LVARKRVARTRLSDDEYAALDDRVRQSGLSQSEYLRSLIVDDLPSKVRRIEQRLEHLESEVARMWLKEGQRNDHQVS
jgi:hypothetical protein